MSHIEQTIEDIESQIRQKQKELEGLQIAVNYLCKLLDPNAAPRYNIKGQSAEMPLTRLKGDEYFRRPKATVITSILQDRKTRKMGPATINEIYEKMIEGGYIFDVKEPKVAIGTAMGKNQKFTRLDNDKWGLTEWYPPVDETPKKRGRPRKKPLAENEQEKPKRGRGRPRKSEQIENKQDELKE